MNNLIKKMKTININKDKNINTTKTININTTNTQKLQKLQKKINFFCKTNNLNKDIQLTIKLFTINFFKDNYLNSFKYKFLMSKIKLHDFKLFLKVNNFNRKIVRLVISNLKRKNLIENQKCYCKYNKLVSFYIDNIILFLDDKFIN